MTVPSAPVPDNAETAVAATAAPAPEPAPAAVPAAESTAAAATMPPTDRPAKVLRIRTILDRVGVEAVTLRTAESLAWLFDGARPSVPFNAPPVLQATVRGDGSTTVHALVNELDRLRLEELPLDDVDFVAVPWHAPLPDVAGSIGEGAIAAELRAARAQLLPLERQRYLALGQELAAAVTTILHGVTPATTERALAARLGEAVLAAGAEPVVLLVAGASRLHLQHPLPTAAPLGRRALAVVGAKRHGMIVNFSRWVQFDAALDPDEAALLEVEADAYDATVPGRQLRDILSEIAAAYPRHGLSADAWLAHHQGGPTGYLGRDPKVTPESTELVQTGQAFAWNPWVPGAKSEDTIILDEAGQRTVVTVDPAWPTVRVRGMNRPTPLILG